ncbi:MAG: glycine zipper domain-containing protein [Pseudomonadales bacterium]|nr:glycine zipper domain-containing protein [Pseudomonadales bacterium]
MPDEQEVDTMRWLFLLLTSFSLTACQGLQDDPIIDPRGVNMTQYQRDLAACRAIAGQVEVGQDTAAGAVAGAVAGAAIGAIVGDSDTAQGGAGVGAVLGGSRAAMRSLREQERVVRRCLNGRGYRVLN